MMKGILRPAMIAGASLWVLLSVACSKSPLMEMTPPPPPPVKDTTFVMNNPVNRELLISLVNDIRTKGCNCGDTFMAAAAPITWSKPLERAAYLHSKDMFENNYFSHNDLEGGNGGKRIASMGYIWKAWGENIALGVLNERTVVDGWFKSVTHCKVLMTSSFREMGVAKVGNFWSQEMAVPKAF